MRAASRRLTAVGVLSGVTSIAASVTPGDASVGGSGVGVIVGISGIGVILGGGTGGMV